MNSDRFFAELTEAIDRGVEADNLAGLLERNPLNGPTKAWRAAAQRCWAAWLLAQELAVESYDQSARALEEEADASQDIAGGLPGDAPVAPG
jgi:hypothetical protein